VRPGWAAGVARARLLLGRALGPAAAREIAARRSLEEATAALAGGAYGERVQPGADLATSQRAVAETLLWHLRILAGWLPAGGATLVRVLAGWFELVNVDARLAALTGDGREPPPFELGALATAWPAIDRARTPDAMAAAVAASAWDEPGGRSPAELALGMRVSWARRAAETAPEASDWVFGAAALLAARELFTGAGPAHVAQLQHLPGVGAAPLSAGSVRELRDVLGPRAAWSLADAAGPDDLFRAELGWWTRVERDAHALLRTTEDRAVVLAAVALLAADAQCTARALAAAARGGDPELVELACGPA
jgi:hypothetical protein